MLECLSEFDSSWPHALEELSSEMHRVDRDACFIWFQFFPLGLHELQQATSDATVLEQSYQFRGHYRLADVVDTSHRFLYGHRYWPAVKQALSALPEQTTLVETIRVLAANVEGPLGVTLPIAAIGLMTFRQVGRAFLGSPYLAPVEPRTSDRLLSLRATDLKSGLFAKPKPRIVIDERQTDGWFPLLPGQHITTAAERDKRPHHLYDSRCTPGNGPIPVDCRSGSCGTCWVGILGGNDRLTPVEDFERKRMEYFGYWENPFHQADSARPLIRLACQTIANGTCSVVIPPWNGVWGAARREAVERRLP